MRTSWNASAGGWRDNHWSRSDWDWNDKYLSPQNSKRTVFTASSAQVRQKINSNSSGYWKKYEDLLSPVRKLLPTYD